MRFCSNCGKELPENTKFCPNCGTGADGSPNPNQAAMAGGVSPVPGAVHPAQVQTTTATGRTVNPGAFSLSFSGRARRSDYWLVSLVSGLVLGATAAYCCFATGNDSDSLAPLVIGLVLICICALLLIRCFAVGVRRCHDLGWSGWVMLLFVLANFIPFGGMASLVLGFLDGQPFVNQYGPDPKGRNFPRQMG